MAELDLPGFRFHPTEEELLEFYLKKMVFKKKFRFDIIGFLNIYHHDPWDLPGLAKIGEREWYFFVPRDRKQGNGGRPNRTTLHGFWKATGSDRQIRSLNDPKKVLGLRKTLVFYIGRAPRGCRTDWVMNEYRMPDTCTVRKDDIVLCKIYRKATSLKVLEERAAMEVESKTPEVVSPSSSEDVIQQFSDEQNNLMTLVPLAKNDKDIVLKAEVEDSIEEFKKENAEKAQSLNVEFALPDLQLPKPNIDWTQDSFWTQFQSPWLLGSLAQYADFLNFSN